MSEAELILKAVIESDDNWQLSRKYLQALVKTYFRAKDKWK